MCIAINGIPAVQNLQYGVRAVILIHINPGPDGGILLRFKLHFIPVFKFHLDIWLKRALPAVHFHQSILFLFGVQNYCRSWRILDQA